MLGFFYIVITSIIIVSYFISLSNERKKLIDSLKIGDVWYPNKKHIYYKDSLNPFNHPTYVVIKDLKYNHNKELYIQYIQYRTTADCYSHCYSQVTLSLPAKSFIKKYEPEK